jgi:hypothetical protein
MKTKEEILVRKRKYSEVYRLSHKEYFNEKNSEYTLNNRKTISERKKRYYLENGEKLRENKRKYYLENKERLNKQSVMRVNKRKNDDKLFKLKTNIRGLINCSIKLSGYRKLSKTQNILGCTFEEFKIYLESKFESWMNWNNYGNWNGEPKEIDTAWDIDHIIPLSSATTEEEIIKLNHYTNLQPLCSYINRHVKRNNINY